MYAASGKRIGLRDTPYRWARMDGMFDRGLLTSLADEYPEAGFDPINRYSGSDKTYRMEVMGVLSKDGGTANLEKVSLTWRRFIDSLVSDDAYRKAVCGLVGIDPERIALEAGFFRFGIDCDISPHCDKRGKVFTHILYFNRNWEKEWGGCLRILGSRYETDVYEEILPLAGTSVMIVRSDKSWHMVSKCLEGIPEKRKTFQIEAWLADGDDDA